MEVFWSQMCPTHPAFCLFGGGGGNMHVRLYEFVNVLCIHVSVHGGKTKKSFIVPVTVLRGRESVGVEGKTEKKKVKGALRGETDAQSQC